MAIVLSSQELGRPTGRNNLRQCIDDAGKDGGFILSTGDQCGRDTPVENLKVIPAGAKIASPAHLFEGSILSEIFKKIRFYYDIVIVDSAPVIPVSDPMLISSEVDGVILVILAGKTPRNVATRARDILLDANANVLGAVVNNLSEVLPYYYDRKYYASSAQATNPPSS